MAEKHSLTPMVCIPRERLAALDDLCVKIIQRSAEDLNEQDQRLGRDLEALLLALQGDISRHDSLVRIWGPTGRRPDRPVVVLPPLDTCPVSKEEPVTVAETAAEEVAA